MMTLTGDVICIGPTPGNESFFQRCILLMGGWSTHNAILLVDEHRREFVYDIASPYARLIPFSEYRGRCEAGLSRMAIVRLAEWDGICPHDKAYHEWRYGIACAIRFADGQHIPYDWRGIISQGRNGIRAALGMQAVLSQSEYKNWCTEGVEKIIISTQRHPMQSLPPQAYPAPIHYERLIGLGVFRIVELCGMDALPTVPARR